MYLIIQEPKRTHKKTIFVETPDEISTEILSITKKVISNSSRFGKDDYLGYADDVSWQVKKKTYIIPLSEYLLPQKFIAINTRGVYNPYTGARLGNMNNKELKLKGKDVTVFPVTQSLTDDEFKVMLGVWSDYKKNVRRTPKQHENNKERLEYLDILEDSAFFNLITVVDVLT